MFTAESIYETFLWLYYRLIESAEQVFSPKRARELARLTIAELVHSAMMGGNTALGPWHLISSEFYGLSDIYRHSLNDQPSLKTTLLILDPSPADLDVLCQAYVAVYEASYLAQLGAFDRLFVRSLIISTDPVTQSDRSIPDWLANTYADNSPLRRAFEAYDQHRCGGQLSCTVRESLLSTERAKTAAWLEDPNS